MVDLIATALLRSVQRDVRFFDQHKRGGSANDFGTGADADGDRPLRPRQFLHHAPAAFRQNHRASAIGIGEDHRELLAAVAGQFIGGTDDPREAARHGAEDIIPGGMPERIVEHLEVIDVEQQ